MYFSASVDMPVHGVYVPIYDTFLLYLPRGSSKSNLTKGECGEAIAEDPSTA